MFKFGNFSKNILKDESNKDVNEESVVPSKEINSCNEGTCFDLNGKHLLFTVEDIDILYFGQKSVLANLKEIDKNILEAEKNHSDLIPGVYEGGLKVWECTYDLANYLYLQMKSNLNDKLILDLGCGSGILGILAFKLGASQVHFQDYNESIIRYLTIPNVAINGKELLKFSKFWSGDWKSFSEVNSNKYDIILTSETIYNPNSHKKLLIALKSLMKIGGIVILAAKSYYFGVGGGINQFLQLIKEDSSFTYEHVWKSEEGITREIIVIKHS